MIGDFKLSAPAASIYEVAATGMRFVKPDEINSLKTYLVMLLSPYAEVDLTADASRAALVKAYADSQYRTVIGADRFVNEQILGKAIFLPPSHNGLVDVPAENATTFAHSDAGGAAAAAVNGLKYKNPKTGEIVKKVIHLSDTATNAGGTGTAANALPQDQYLYSLGHLRFQTKFIRNLLFIVSAHRMMNAKMNEELSKHPLPVVSGPQASHSSMANKSEWEW
jgi:hypothetical protein